ncbi:Ig-like domain-containing protein [Candidatus Spongiihabitans sp.]|uniref:Ig-like domain-containing protein n=1 Tax=Candidatus Spongiihabitans sp. TaxID=3101308 RepID=UPI003C6F8285
MASTAWSQNTPAAPVITSTTPSLTKQPDLTVSGTAEADSTITLTNNGTSLPTVTATDGNWSITLTLTEGANTFTVTATDSSDNVSDPTGSVSVTLDTIRPDPPVINQPQPLLVTINFPTFTGTGEPGATLVLIQNNNALEPVVIDADGNRSIVIDLKEGNNVFIATQTDPAGNQSIVSVPVINDLDTIPPPVPKITTSAATVTTSSFTLVGTAVDTTSVGVYNKDSFVANANLDRFGNWSITLTLNQGENSLTVTSRDALGNESALSEPVIITLDDPNVDSTPPPVPVITSTTPSLTKQPDLTVSGTAEADSTITLTNNGTSLPTVTATDGNWSITLTLTEGANVFTVTATDSSNNISDSTESVSVTLDTIRPDPPVINQPQPLLTNINFPTFTGTGEPGSTLTLIQNNKALPTVVIDSDGNWSIIIDLKEGNNVFIATTTDAAGNQSIVSVTVTNDLDTTPPPVPTITSTTPSLTNQPDLTVSGTAEADSTITLTNNGTPLPTVSTTSDGNWSVTVTLTEGANAFTVTATDASGNVSDPTQSVSVTLDTIRPDPPVINQPQPLLTNIDFPTFTGTGEPGSTLVLIQNNNALTGVLS